MTRDVRGGHDCTDHQWVADENGRLSCGVCHEPCPCDPQRCDFDRFGACYDHGTRLVPR